MSCCAQGATWGRGTGGFRAAIAHVTPQPGHRNHGDCRTGLAGANPGAAQLLDMPKPIQDGPSHVTVLSFCLCSASTSLYDYEISGPLGRENYKEMYLFIYR